MTFLPKAGTKLAKQWDEWDAINKELWPGSEWYLKASEAERTAHSRFIDAVLKIRVEARGETLCTKEEHESGYYMASCFVPPKPKSL